MVFEAMTAHNGREWAARAAMLLAAAVQVAPIVGVLGGRRLRALYGVTVTDPTVELLLRHRAVLLALVGVLLAIGALRPQHRALALSVGLVAKLTFLALSSRSIGPRERVRPRRSRGRCVLHAAADRRGADPCAEPRADLAVRALPSIARAVQRKRTS